MPFLPSMTQQQVSELDARRTQGDIEPYTNPTYPINKKPWLNQFGVHKGEPMAAKSGEGAKEFFDEEKKEPEHKQGFDSIKEFADQEKKEKKHKGSSSVASWLKEELEEKEHTEKGNPPPTPPDTKFDFSDVKPKPPSGELSPWKKAKTAIETKMENIKQFVRPKDGAPKSSTKTKFDVNYGKNAPLANSMEDEAKAMPGMAASPAPMMSPAPPAPMMAGSALGKALSSRSMFIPRPMGAYDPFGIQRSATQLPVHTASVTEYGTMQQHPSAAYKSCSTHGITYRSDLGCHPCTVSKSRECSQCGIEMHKAMGGVLRCPRGH
jgi:hypothetical protein